MARTTKVPPKHVERIVRNQSSRLGAPIQAVAVHSTEGVDLPGSRDDLDALHSWFDNPASDASSHIGVDGDGHIDRYVDRQRKAWTILQLNAVTWNIEFVAKAAQAPAAWEDIQVKRAAQYAAFICLKENIPAQRGVVRNVSGFPVISRRGIITHKQLTDVGFGTHQDPGPAFPMDDFIRAVQWYKRNGWPAP